MAGVVAERSQHSRPAKLGPPEVGVAGVESDPALGTLASRRPPGDLDVHRVEGVPERRARELDIGVSSLGPPRRDGARQLGCLAEDEAGHGHLQDVGESGWLPWQRQEVTPLLELSLQIERRARHEGPGPVSAPSIQRDDVQLVPGAGRPHPPQD